MEIHNQDLVYVPLNGSCNILFSHLNETRSLNSGNTLIHFHNPKYIKNTNIKFPIAYAGVGRTKWTYEILSVCPESIWCIKKPSYVKGVR